MEHLTPRQRWLVRDNRYLMALVRELGHSDAWAVRRGRVECPAHLRPLRDAAALAKARITDSPATLSFSPSVGAGGGEKAPAAPTSGEAA